MILTPDQQVAHDGLIEYARKPDRSHLTLGGYAGTGKTTVTAATIETLRRVAKLRIAFCCFTGKAASVLRFKLANQFKVLNDSPCTTIHDLMYDTHMDKQGRFSHRRRAELPYDLVVVDEASMVNEAIWKDLSSYRKPIIAVGDHGQLPPVVVGETKRFSLMEAPVLRLEQIHRQVADHPIIKLSMLARTGAFNFKVGHFENSPFVSMWYKPNAQIVAEAQQRGHLTTTLFLTYTNKHRQQLNNAIREALGYRTARPQVGERIICLKNNHEAHVYNGVTGVVEAIEDSADPLCYWMAAKMDDGVAYRGRVLRQQFLAEETIKLIDGLSPFESNLIDRFDFGYALTVHKSQGSEAERVTLLMYRPQQINDEYWSRWLYTAVTRAKNSLQIINRTWTPKPEAALP